MTDGKQDLQADGADGAKGGGDGVSQPQVSGRTAGGESGGGGYPNPHSGKTPQGGPDTFLGHGGQAEQEYSGPGQTTGDKAGGDENGRVGQGG